PSEDVEGAGELGVGCSRRVTARRPERPGRVARVALPDPADVEDDRLAGADDAVGRLVVWRRGVRARRDDREVWTLMAFGREPVPRLARDVRLGAPDEPARRDLVDDAIGRLRRLAEELDLLGVLRHPQLPRNGGSPLEADAGQLRLEPEDVARPERVVHPDRPPTA